MHVAWRDMSCQYYLVFLLLLSSTPKKLYLVFLFSSSKSFSITRSICKSHYCFGDICSIKLSKKDTQTKLENHFIANLMWASIFFLSFPANIYISKNSLYWYITYKITLPNVKDPIWLGSSYQYRSPNRNLLNWSPTIHWKVGPNKEPSSGRSMVPPIYKSTSSMEPYNLWSRGTNCIRRNKSSGYMTKK